MTRGTLAALLPGLIIAALLAALAVWLADQAWIKSTTHVSALLLVILLGMAWRSLAPVPVALEPGLRFAQRPVLRWAVAGLGFRLSLAELVQIGAPALVVVVVSTLAALLFAWWLAARLRVPEKLGILIAVGVITLLGTIGIVLYPLLHHPLGLTDFAYGVWDGASLHEMAQVVAAGFGVSDDAARVATVVKLARICLLAPVVLYLGWSLRHRHQAAGAARVAPVPWFLGLFVLFALLNSSGWLPKSAIETAKTVDLWLLCVGMAGVGLETSFAEIGRAGVRPVALGAAQWLVISGIALALTRALCR